MAPTQSNAVMELAALPKSMEIAAARDQLEGETAMYDRVVLQAKADFLTTLDTVPDHGVSTCEVLEMQMSTKDARSLQHRTDACTSVEALPQAFCNILLSLQHDKQQEDSKHLQVRTDCRAMMSGIAEEYDAAAKEDELDLSLTLSAKTALQARTDPLLDEELVHAHAHEFAQDIQEMAIQVQAKRVLGHHESFIDSVKDLPQECTNALHACKDESHMDAHAIQKRTDSVCALEGMQDAYELEVCFALSRDTVSAAGTCVHESDLQGLSEEYALTANEDLLAYQHAVEEAHKLQQQRDAKEAFSAQYATEQESLQSETGQSQKDLLQTAADCQAMLSELPAAFLADGMQSEMCSMSMSSAESVEVSRDALNELPAAYAMSAYCDAMEASLARADARQLQLRADKQLQVNPFKPKARAASQAVLDTEIAHRNKRVMLETDKPLYCVKPVLPKTCTSTADDVNDDSKPSFERQISDASTVAPAEGLDRQISDASTVA